MVTDVLVGEGSEPREVVVSDALRTEVTRQTDRLSECAYRTCALEREGVVVGPAHSELPCNLGDAAGNHRAVVVEDGGQAERVSKAVVKAELRRQRRAIGGRSPEVFASVYLADHCKLQFSRMHKEIFTSTGIHTIGFLRAISE